MACPYPGGVWQTGSGFSCNTHAVIQTSRDRSGPRARKGVRRRSARIRTGTPWRAPTNEARVIIPPHDPTTFGSSMATIQNQRPLPPAWRWVRLGEVIAEAQPGFACGARDLKGVVQLRMNNVDTRGNMVWKEFIRVPAEESVVNEYQLRTGDVLFNNTNSVELVGKSALFLGFREPVVYSNHFTRLRALAEQLDPQYFAAWLLHQWQLKVFENICNRWIGQSAVKNDKLLALGIPLPPLEEQKRVAAILNEQIAAVERARAAAKALPAAYLRAVFSSPEAQQWPGRSLRDVTTRITDGTHQPPPFTRQGVPFLFVRNIVGGQIDFSVDNYVSRETYEKLTER